MKSGVRVFNADRAKTSINLTGELAGRDGMYERLLLDDVISRTLCSRDFYDAQSSHSSCVSFINMSSDAGHACPLPKRMSFISASQA